jgi:RNA polymerase sigma-70 factor (ECF subfamily)
VAIGPERGSDEQELVDGLHADDPGALAALFDRYGDRIYNHCFRHLADWAEAEDATSSVFLEVWRHRRRVRLHDGSALPWLYGVATNVCRNAGRSRRRYLRAVARVPAPAAEPDHAELVTDRVEALPPREREVLGLVAWAGLSYEQAAAALDVPVGTVRSRLSRARARLTDLTEENPDD